MPTLPRDPARTRAGFTILELLVALLVAGILTTIILQLMQGNSRFVSLQSAREEVQQNGRAALDLVASDLRAVPPDGFVEHTSSSIRFYLPRAWGILCEGVSSAEVNPTVYVLLPTGAFPEDFPAGGAAHWGIALEQTGDPSIPTGEYRYLSGAAPQGAGSHCDAVQPNQTGAHDARAFAVIGTAVGSGTGTVQPGTQVMIFEETGYDVAQMTTGSRERWVRRMAGYSNGQPNMQPMAGPVPSDQALEFTYMDAAGQAISDPATADIPSLVRKIRIRIELQSRSKMVQAGSLRPMQMDTMTTEVTLRNQS